MDQICHGPGGEVAISAEHQPDAHRNSTHLLNLQAKNNINVIVWGGKTSS